MSWRVQEEEKAKVNSEALTITVTYPQASPDAARELEAAVKGIAAGGVSSKTFSGAVTVTDSTVLIDCSGSQDWEFGKVAELLEARKLVTGSQAEEIGQFRHDGLTPFLENLRQTNEKAAAKRAPAVSAPEPRPELDLTEFGARRNGQAKVHT